MAKFQLFLESISQAGDVGREISFRITSPSGINKTVGLKTKHRALTEKTPFENSHTVGLEVNATERDSKYPDHGKGAGFIYVSAILPSSDTSISVQVREESGARKTNRKATFTLNFLAEVQPDKIEPESHETSADGADFIRSREGLVLPNAKDDGFGNMTIGYGHKVDPKNEPELVHGSITREKAEKLFQRDLRKAEAAVARHVTVPQTQRQRDAVASLIFNIGAERFNRSKLKEAINNNAGKAAITKEWSEFRLARDQKTGLLKPSEGLKERRKLEINRYFNPGP